MSRIFPVDKMGKKDKFDLDQVESWKTSTDSDKSDAITDLGFYITKEDGTQLVQNVDFAAVNTAFFARA